LKSRSAIEQRLWQLMWLASLLSILIVGVAALLLGFGLANPSVPTGHFQTDKTLLWTGTNEITLNPSETFIATHPEPVPNAAFFIEVEASISSIDPLAAWGIWLEDDNRQWLVASVNADQYVTARLCDASFQSRLEDCMPLVEPTQRIWTFWKNFHLINPSGETNQIRLSYQPNQWNAGLELRLNSAWMWDLTWQVPLKPIRWGIWAKSGPDESAQFI